MNIYTSLTKNQKQKKKATSIMKYIQDYMTPLILMKKKIHIGEPKPQLLYFV